MQVVIDPREERGKQIAVNHNQVIRDSDSVYRVKSQSSPRYYHVNDTPIGWKCNCPDHKFRGSKCKHILGRRDQLWIERAG